jgi:hypothetical protein
MPACRPTFYVIGKSSQGIFNSLRGQVDRLPLGIVEAWRGPEGRVGGWVDRRIAQGKLPRFIERDDGPADGDRGCCLQLIRWSRSNGTENKAGQQCQQKTAAIHRAEPFRHISDASTIQKRL